MRAFTPRRVYTYLFETDHSAFTGRHRWRKLGDPTFRRGTRVPADARDKRASLHIFSPRIS
jgi:hypothetical protein